MPGDDEQSEERGDRVGNCLHEMAKRQGEKLTMPLPLNSKMQPSFASLQHHKV